MKQPTTIDYGKIPPSDLDYETAVLGALILEPEAYLSVSDILTPIDFYKESHVHIFDTIVSLFAENQPIDMMTIVDRLRRNGKLEEIGGAYYITTLTAKVASAAHLQKHALVLAELSIRRKLIQEASNILQSAYDVTNDIDTVVDSTITIIDRVVLDKSKNSKVVTIAEACVQFIDQLSEHQKFDNKTVGQISTTIESLKKIVPYYLGGNLIVIAGRPAMGKTSFVLNEIWNSVKNGQKFLFFSLEMSARELAGRLIQHESGVTQFDMDRKLMPYEYEKLDKAMAKIEKTGLFIDDTGGVSFAHIRAKVKVYVKLHGINGIVIDYLQLMGTDRSLPREQQVAQLSGQLKALAKEFDIPVFLLAQLNRNAESRSNDGFKPKLSDLRESGAIEQDADIVMFPHRPEYYYPNDADLKGKAMVIVSKHRNGKVGEAELKVDLSRHKWTDVYEATESYTNEAVNLTFEPKQNNDYSSYERPF